MKCTHVLWKKKSDGLVPGMRAGGASNRTADEILQLLMLNAGAT